jgi:tRNA threonylcarbamoyladenosine biosynthesis protein TsaE
MNKKSVVFTTKTEETEQCGADLASMMLQSQDLPHFVALYGDLGVGKTAFVRGFTSVISPTAIVRSPTFALVNEYRAKPLSVFHFDMYRIESEDDLISIGYDDYLMRNGICLVEWSEKIPYAIPEEYVKVLIEKDDFSREHSRKITTEIVTEDL